MELGKYNTRTNGQSLIELMIGITIATVLIGGASSALMVTLRSNLMNKSLRAASGLAQDLLDKAAVLAESRWRNIYDLSKSPNQWRLTSSGGVFTPQSGSEIITTEGINYERYFTADNVQRDSSGNIVLSGGTDDPSTQLITITVAWPQGGSIATLSRSRYLTRTRNLIWRSDSSGNGNESPVFDTGVSGGAAPNTIMWQGSGGTVGFRLASSDSSGGPWNYLGPNGNPAVYYQSSGPNVQAPITLADHNNKRYARYRLYYLSGTPQVSEIILNYSP